jgi:hypothetical protein
MLLAPILRAIGLQTLKLPSRTLSGDALGSRAQRPRSIPRCKPVRGAASEPHFTDAGFNSTSDGQTEIVLA